MYKVQFTTKHIHISDIGSNKKDFAIICLSYDGILIPHPFNDYFFSYYINLSYYTQNEICSIICSFLNHLISQGISNLTVISIKEIESFLYSKSLEGVKREKETYKSNK